MLKIALITFLGAGVLGTGAKTFTPQAVQVTAGAITFEAGTSGMNISPSAHPDFAVTLKTKGERDFTVRF